MASFRKRGKVWYYRFVDADGQKQEQKGCSDRRVTEEIARAAESSAARIRSRLDDPKVVAIRHHDARPLGGHIDDWHAYMLAKGSTPKHADLSRNRTRRVTDLARVDRISALAPSRIQAALKEIRDGGLSLRSLHHYTRAIKEFSRWLWKDGRASENGLAHLTSPNPDQDRRHERRALSPEELVRLLRAAQGGRIVCKLTGPDRAALYLVALGTGFRANELRHLTPDAFDLDGDPPTITVKAAYSKHRRDDVQPIRTELADSLRAWLADKPSGEQVFGNLTKNTVDLIRHDLQTAGIPYCDDSGRYADFHSLRHSYVTALAMSSAPVKIVQSLARHSTPTLTLGVYAHVGLFDQSAALDALPDLSRPDPANPETTALAATGTDGGFAHRFASEAAASLSPNPGTDATEPEPISKLFAHYLPTGGDGEGGIAMASDGIAASNLPTQTIAEMPENTGFEGTGRHPTEPDGTEGVGFEPTDSFHCQRFSRPSRSTTLAPLLK